MKTWGHLSPEPSAFETAPKCSRRLGVGSRTGGGVQVKISVLDSELPIPLQIKTEVQLATARFRELNVDLQTATQKLPLNWLVNQPWGKVMSETSGRIMITAGGPVTRNTLQHQRAWSTSLDFFLRTKSSATSNAWFVLNNAAMLSIVLPEKRSAVLGTNPFHDAKGLQEHPMTQRTSSDILCFGGARVWCFPLTVHSSLLKKSKWCNTLRRSTALTLLRSSCASAGISGLAADLLQKLTKVSHAGLSHPAKNYQHLMWHGVWNLQGGLNKFCVKQLYQQSANWGARSHLNDLHFLRETSTKSLLTVEAPDNQR